MDNYDYEIKQNIEWKNTKMSFWSSNFGFWEQIKQNLSLFKVLAQSYTDDREKAIYTFMYGIWSKAKAGV